MRYRVDLGVATGGVPHDLLHFVAEQTLEEAGGFWGAVADGAVFRSMRHVDGRRPAHAQRRSKEAIAKRKGLLTRAELLAGLIEQIAAGDVRDEDMVRRMTTEALSTQRDASISPTRARKAADRLVEMQERWSSLEEGGEIVLTWTGSRLRARH